MATYSFNDMGGVEIDFNGVKPSLEIRNKMKAVKYRWNPTKLIWWAYKNDDTVAVAKEICGNNEAVSDNANTAESASQNDEKPKAVKKIASVAARSYTTISGRRISYYGAEHGATIETVGLDNEFTLDEFFGILLRSWVKESAYPSSQKDPEYCLENDPTYGQCAVTAMLVNKFFGGEIRKIRVSGGGTHYFNVIDGEIFDLTRDQFDLYRIPVDYTSGVNMPLQYCGKNANTKARYDILEKNVMENIQPGKAV